jgi:hypothetical protein
MFVLLIIIHVTLTMAGYVGLISANVWLLMLCRSASGEALIIGVRAWRRVARIFGPLLFVGMLFGFGVALTIGIPLTSRWLVLAYALIVLALVTQATIMVPWQLRAEGIIAQGKRVPIAPIMVTLSILSAIYLAIASLMLARPG